MRKIQAASYQVCIGDIAGELNRLVAAGQYAKVFVLVDANTERDCLPLFKELTDFSFSSFSVPAGELHKHLGTCESIWDAMFSAGLGRRDLMINLGGGVIGDMGGFCAGTYKRGIDFIQVPTTLLSQVDASVGGKLGVDFKGLKNAVGLFKNPQAVLIDPRFLKTLPERELKSGMAEVFKHGLIADKAYWNISKDNTDYASLVETSVRIKNEIVTEDPFEDGLRKALNFGHTIGHAVESYFLETPTPLLHGEAIGIGMVCEAFLSVRKAGLSLADAEEIKKRMIGFYGKVEIPEFALPELLSWMRKDKKNEKDEINFTLLPEIGKVKVNASASPEEIEESLAFYAE